MGCGKLDPLRRKPEPKCAVLIGVPHKRAMGLAQDQGAKFYCNGIPCPKGHETLRYASSGACHPCALAALTEQPEKQAAETRALNRKLRGEAFLAGHTYYMPASPCKRGHTSIRYVSSNGCVACHEGA